MLKKIIAIKGVGTFAGYGSKGDLSFRPFTAIWGPNGVGKSTICDVLRSYGVNDPALIVGRRTLGANIEPEVDLLFDEGKRLFRKGVWDAPATPSVHVFDSYFVHENIFVGDFVEHDQKKNLYRVIVGEEGVSLAAAVDDLDDELREATKDTGVKKDIVEKPLPVGLSVEAFIALAPDPGILEKITAKEQELAALQQAETVAKRAALTEVSLPSIPEDLDEVLGTTLDGIGADAEQRVRAHVAKVHARESWLSEGIRLVRDEQCPFCGQDASSTDLLPAYRAYFSESYGALKERVAVHTKEIATSFGPAALLLLRSTVSRNAELADEWSALVGSSFGVILDLAPVDAVRDVLTEKVRQKEGSLLEACAGVGGSEAAAAYAQVRYDAAAYNDAVSAFNTKVAEVKRRVKGGNVQDVSRELALLRAQRDRFESAAIAACNAYTAAVALREDLDKRKAEAKNQLDQHATAILGAYQEAINRFLQKFGAGFRIKKLERKYVGGAPSSSYVLEINNAQVELGGRSTSRSERSFRNTLSGGDRSALSLAFFLAQIERDPGIAKKIVVLDDPFTSQDRGRRLATQQEIRRIRSRAAQVIVLSHDDTFLGDCCSDVAAGDLKTLQLRRSLAGPLLEEWDVNAPRGQGLQDRQHLKEFLAEGAGDAAALRDVARTIRPLLEAYLRGRFLGKFSDLAWLADMIKILRENQNKLAEGADLPDELGAINEFSRRYHHAQNPGADTEPIDETELRTYVERALNVADGF